MPRTTQHHRGLTTIEVLVIVALLALVIGILLPAIGAARRTASCVQSNTQVRGIHQSLVMYSQNNGSYYPGLDANGDIIDATVEYRYTVMLDANLFTGEYMLSPAELKTEWTTGPVTSANYAYAMLDINAPGQRAAEWRSTLNDLAVTLGDRNTGSDTRDHISSIHTDTDSGDWRGQLAWNDGHTSFNTTHLIKTRYGSGDTNDHDNLFEDGNGSGGGDDAYLIYTGD